jgi:hypothetical protein
LVAAVVLVSIAAVGEVPRVAGAVVAGTAARGFAAGVGFEAAGAGADVAGMTFEVSGTGADAGAISCGVALFAGTTRPSGAPQDGQGIDAPGKESSST